MSPVLPSTNNDLHSSTSTTATPQNDYDGKALRHHDEKARSGAPTTIAPGNLTARNRE